MGRPGNVRAWRSYDRWRRVRGELVAQGLTASDAGIAMHAMWREMDAVFAFRSRRNSAYSLQAMWLVLADATEQKQQPKEDACTSTAQG